MPTIRPAASRLALALALATTAAVGMTAAATPAFAQKKEKEAPAAKANYSKPFVAAYTPIQKGMNEGGDLAPVKAQLPGLFAAASTPDDKYAAGQIAYSLGAKTSDVALQTQGLDMMLDSGKTAPADLARNSFASAQLAYNAKNYAKARARAQEAIAAGYTGDAELIIAETYFADNQPQAGVAEIEKAIAKKAAANQPVPEAWLKRALAKAYEAKLDQVALKYSGLYAQYYPSTNSWGDAVAIQRNMYNFEGHDLLDLMRLAARTNALRSERDYADYINAVDARRMPGEAQRIITQGLQAKLLRENDPFVVEAKKTAEGRIAADRADLPGLERDARASGATAVTATAAGDTFLNYQQAAKAEEFYTIALTKPGVDTQRVLTRLGIAQLDQGKVAEAKATFAKVTGPRQPIAQLWTIYAGQKGA